MPRPHGLSLTGKTQYRESLLGKLILQVEEHIVTGTVGEDAVPVRSTQWRDAKRSDLPMLRWLKKPRGPAPSPPVRM